MLRTHVVQLTQELALQHPRKRSGLKLVAILEVGEGTRKRCQILDGTESLRQNIIINA
jgi:hypothetical protein